MSQPVWKLVANLGDVSYTDHGGYFVFEDTTGAYGFEAEYLETVEYHENVDDYGKEQWTVHRVCLDKCKIVRSGDTLYLVSANYDPSWPHPLASYAQWFAESLDSVASCMDTTRDEIEAALCSDDGIARANAYRQIYDYHGWANGDSYPLTLTRREVAARYDRETRDNASPAEVHKALAAYTADARVERARKSKR